MIERAIILCKTESLKASDFQTGEAHNSEKEKEKINFNLEENELKLVHLALKEMNYNQNKTAELLGITRDALIRRMKKYNIKVSKSSSTTEDE
jgi:DNA-binding NtrC family response regulator